eukprot:GHUV01032539.1.p1 GENE.GHUV01032539.1~~GHUV01032539.1.p1  ORF type:complete len:108 (+),score=21.06 GHUV01032539.1:114-437(+)
MLLVQVIADYHTPEGKSLTRDLMGTINSSVDFLVRCRPLSVSMGNAIKALKLYLSKIDPAGTTTAAAALLYACGLLYFMYIAACATAALLGYRLRHITAALGIPPGL